MRRFGRATLPLARVRPRSFCWSMILVLAACSGRESGVSVTDSAGVRLVMNEATAGWSDSTAWTATTNLTIGTEAGGEEYQFSRIGDLDVAPNGDIAVVDQLAGVIRIFNDSGIFLRSIGRSGKGPGELSRSANGIYFVGDSVLLLDPGERRRTVFAQDGTVGAVTPLPAGPTGQGWSRLASGDFLMRGLTISRVDGKFAFWDALLAVRGDTAVSDTLFAFDYTKTDLGGPPKIRIPLIVNNPTWARLSDGRIAWTALDRHYVQIHDSTGRIVARVSSVQWSPKPVTPSDKAAMVELLRTKYRAIGGDPSFADSPQVEAPAEFPAITTVRAGPQGTIWVQQMGPVESIDPMAINAPDRADFLGGPAWHVLDSSGVFVGTIELPKRFRIFRMRENTIYGAARDDIGVERILRLHLSTRR
jgi:hypothetical protein